MDLDLFLQKTGFTTYNGKNVGIAVIDTGCNIELPNIKYKFNAFTKTDIVNDTRNHGTVVTQIINHIAPNADLYIFKGIDDYGQGSSLSLYESLLQIRDNKDIDLICMSFSSFQELNPLVEKILNDCIDNGKKVIASLGNDNTNKLTYPATANGVWAVGAFNSDLTDKEKDSNYGTKTNFMALGEIEFNNNSYNGTSYANAIVVGQLANLLSEVDDKESLFTNISQFLEKDIYLEHTAFGCIIKK